MRNHAPSQSHEEPARFIFGPSCISIPLGAFPRRHPVVKHTAITFTATTGSTRIPIPPTQTIFIVVSVEIPARNDNGIACFSEECANQNCKSVTAMAPLAAHDADINSRRTTF